MLPLRAALGAACVVCAALASADSLAQGYPLRPVRLVVPYPPGGPNDVIARTMAPELSKVLGQQIIVENRPGAGGNTATGYAGAAHGQVADCS